MGVFLRVIGLLWPKRLVWLALILGTGAFAQSAPEPVDAAALARFERAVELAREKPGEAIEMFESLIRDHPSWPEPYNNLAVLYAERGEEKKAEQALLAAMGTHPSYALVHKNLEALYAGMAGRAYRKALKGNSAGPPPPKLALADEIGAATLSNSRAASPRVPPQATPPSEPAPAAGAVARAPAVPEPEPPRSGEESRLAVLSTVSSWLEAWSSQDVDRYLSFYGHHFDPGKGMTREQWAEIRRRRVAGPEFIHIDIQNPSVTFDADDRASVRFLQSYRSNTFEGRTIKTLRLSRGSDGWKIIREETGS